MQLKILTFQIIMNYELTVVDNTNKRKERKLKDMSYKPEIRHRRGISLNE
jgi:hypothetical protein